MSGGVDSSLVAATLRQQGHDVIGVTLQLYSYEQDLEETDPAKRNCHPSAFLNDARQVAQRIGIEHHILDRQELFRTTIIDPFMQAYSQGKTPLPCARCNRDVKTQALYALMKEMGAEALATGHYVRRVEVDGRVELHQGQDPRRDQSFFLFALAPHQLEVSYFPLGAHSKDETRGQARAFGLETAETPASQDLCFIAKKSYTTLFQAVPGDICDLDGRVIGQHQGIARYTIGQRQGLAVGGHSEPLYVVAIDSQSNRIIVGPRAALARKQIHLEDVNWLAPDYQSFGQPAKSHAITVRLRSSAPKVPAQVLLAQDLKTASVHLDQPDYGIAPGQACVFYDGTRVLGGGWIESAQ
jgi:tRNA-uridine 2-sulfurtransferase